MNDLILLSLIGFFCVLSPSRGISQQEETAKPSAGVGSEEVGEGLFTPGVWQYPTFQGKDIKEFREWVSEGLFYPLQATDTVREGRSAFIFMVTREGKVKDVQVLRGLHPVVDSVISDRISNSPDWQPQIQAGGHTVSSRFTVWLDFSWENAVFSKVERMPQFQGEEDVAFRNWVQAEFDEEFDKDHTRDLLEEAHGRITLSFVVGSDGWVKEVEVLAAPDRNTGEVAARAVLNSPRWTPGSHHGHPVAVKYVIPVNLRLQ